MYTHLHKGIRSIHIAFNIPQKASKVYCFKNQIVHLFQDRCQHLILIDFMDPSKKVSIISDLQNKAFVLLLHSKTLPKIDCRNLLKLERTPIALLNDCSLVDFSSLTSSNKPRFAPPRTCSATIIATTPIYCCLLLAALAFFSYTFGSSTFSTF